MSDIKEDRKIARFYGAKALTGRHMSDKTIAESIRADFLRSDAKEEDKAEFLDCDSYDEIAKYIQSAKFWILHKDVPISEFGCTQIHNEYTRLLRLKHKHWRTLACTGPVQDKNEAKDEIINQIKNSAFKIYVSFPNFDPFYQLDINL